MSEKAGNLSNVAGTGSIIGVFAFNGCHHKGIHLYITIEMFATGIKNLVW